VKKVLLIVLSVLIVAIAASVTYLLVTGKGENPDIASVEGLTSETDKGEGGIVVTNNQGKNNKKAKEEPTVFYDLGTDFITNVKNSNRYLKVTLAMEITNEEAKKEIQAQEVKVKDVIISVLRSKTVEDLTGDDSQENLKRDIKKALVEKLGLEDIINLYINEFVMQ